MNRAGKYAVALAGAAVAATAGRASASLVAFQGFESSSTDTWAYTETTNAATGNNGAVSTTVGATDSPANSRIDSGAASFQVSTTADGTAQTATLTFASVDVTGFQNLEIDIPVAAISTSGSNGLDTSDLIQAYVSLNNAAFSSTPDVTLEGNGNARYAFSSTGTATTTAGTGTGTTSGKLISSNPFVVQSPAGGTTTTGISNLYIDIPAGTTSVALRVAATDNSNSATTAEVWALDNIQLNGTAVPEPASIGLVSIGAAGLLSRRRQRRIV